MTGTDPTPQNANDAVTAHQDEVFRAIFEKSPVGIGYVGMDNVYSLVNDALCETLGYTRDELLQKTFIDVTHPDDVESSLAARRKLASGKLEHYVTEKRYVHKDGCTIWVRIMASPVCDPLGHVEHFVSVVEDITLRKQAEWALKESEDKFSKAFRTCPDVMSITDFETGRYLEVNDAFEKVFGYTRDEIIGHSPVDFGIVQDSDERQQIIETLKSDGRVRDVEISATNRKGETLILKHSAELIELGGRTCALRVSHDITECKNAMEEMCRCAAETHDLYEHAPCGYHSLDANGVFVRINATELSWLGYSREEIIGNKAFADLLTPGSRQLFFENYPEFKIRGTVRDLQFEMVRKDGSIMNILLNATAVRDSEGNFTMSRSTVHDITAHKIRESALRVSEERFAGAFACAAIGMALVAPDGRWLKVNRALCNLTGYSEEELMQGRFQDITHPDDLEKDLELTRQMLTGEIPHYQLEKRYVHKQGYNVWILLSVSLVRDDQHNPLYFVSQIQDITERKQASEQIAGQAELLNKTQDAICVRDVDGKVLFWNKAAERIYGWTADEIVGLRTADLIYGERKLYEETHIAVLEQGEWSGEVNQVTKDRRLLIVQERLSLVRGDDGKPKSILTITTDVTEQKKIEAQLLRAQRMESIGTLAGGIAHDLNNILAPILMSIEILKSFVSDPAASNILETINVSAARGADIVRQVLSFARGLDGQRIEIQPKHLFKDIEHLVKDTFPKNIQFQFTASHDAWPILGDPTQLYQVFLNLCVNARDAMPNGGLINVTLENRMADDHYAAMHSLSSAGPYIDVIVTDSGVGIPPEHIGRIFEPFFTTKSIGTGSGLGLSTVMAVVKNHGGFVNVYSEMGKGTSFHICLPARPLSEPPYIATVDTSLPRGNGELILLIDDEGSVLTITSQTLQAFGYRVITATDGTEALAFYAEHRSQVAAVLTDIMMPIMDGTATIRALRKMNPAVKIIAASGLNTKSDPTKETESGVKHYLAKPYTARTLLETLHAILNEN